MIRAPKGVRALFSDVNKVGKRIKASKKKYTWKFSIDSHEHTVDMYVSSLSGKRKVLVDGDLRYNGKAQAGVYFQFPIKIDRVMVVIEQLDESWDLKIGGVSFSQLAMMKSAMPDSEGRGGGIGQLERVEHESEYGQVHNKWDDWDEKPKPKAQNVWTGGQEERLPARDREDYREQWDRGSRDKWEEPEPRPQGRQQDFGWETKPYGKRGDSDEDDYQERRVDPPQDFGYYRDERGDDRRYRPRDEEPRARPRDDDPRRGRDDDFRARPRDDEYRPRPRDDDPRRRPREDDYGQRRRPSPRRDEDYRDYRVDPAKRAPREEERPKQEVDPFGIHEPEPQRQDDYEGENMYPSLNSLRPSAQPYPTYQPVPPPAAPDPFGAPIDFAPAASTAPASDPFQAGGVFDSKPASDPFAPSPGDFKVTSSKPFDDDLFGPPKEPPRRAPEADLAGLVDLDGLNLGDNYSPAVMRKHEEQSKAVSIGIAAPNLPMNQLKPNPDPRQMQTMPMGAAPMVPNPMAAMMMQQYMTGMMMSSMMMNQGGVPPQPRYY